MSGVIFTFFGDNDVASSSETYKPSNSKVYLQGIYLLAPVIGPVANSCLQLPGA